MSDLNLITEIIYEQAYNDSVQNQATSVQCNPLLAVIDTIRVLLEINYWDNSFHSLKIHLDPTIDCLIKTGRCAKPLFNAR